MSGTGVRIAAVPAAAILVLLVLGGTASARMYDLKTVETIAGEVLKVEQVAEGRGRSQGVHLLVKTEKEEIAVHLGPAWYHDRQAVKIAAGDNVTVKGSRVTFNGKAAIIAAEVTKGESVLRLRDEAGVPVWSRRGRRR